MQNLFASSGITAMTIMITFIQLASLATAGIGFLCYRSLINSQHAFLSSLYSEKSKIKKVRFGILLWMYVLLTLLISIVTIGIYLWLPRFL